MAEVVEPESRKSSPEVGASAAALAVAMQEARSSPGLENDLRAFLERQNQLVEEQLHHLAAQYHHLKVQHASDLLKLGFQVFAALAATFVAVILMIVLWQAATDRSLVVDAFSAPPDFAARGLTSRAVSAQLLDDLLLIDHRNSSARAASTYANSWDREVKVDIPETGISLAEAERLLHKLLGHQTLISGEIFREGAGLVATVRAGTGSAGTIRGTDEHVDALIQAAAESVYAQTQPYLYARYLQLNGRQPEAVGVYRDLIGRGDPLDRVWARVGLSRTLTEAGDVRAAERLDRDDVGEAPDFFLGRSDLADDARALGHDAESLAQLQAARAALPRTSGDVSREAAKAFEFRLPALIADTTQDYPAALTKFDPLRRMKTFNDSVALSTCLYAQDLALSHDLDGARRALPTEFAGGDIGGVTAPTNARALFGCLPVWNLQRQAGNWSAGLADLQALARSSAIQSPAYAEFRARVLAPWLGLALAMTGDFPAARAMLSGLPRDCYLCARIEGQVLARAADAAGSEAAFARAVALAPSIASAYQEWGEARLARSDRAGAEWAFRQAHDHAPHWADPLKSLGDLEAVSARRQAALATYEMALAEAPHWAQLRAARDLLRRASGGS